jgi:predicted nucleic acid-binding protein
MNVLYLETSSLLAWLFNEKSASDIIEQLNGTDLIVTSDLLRIEAKRAINRSITEKMLTFAEGETLIQLLNKHLKGWFIMGIDEAIVERASELFPAEPVKSLDAIHLATAMEYQKVYPQVVMATVDKRIWENGELLGLTG